MIFSAGALRKCGGVGCQDVTNNCKEQPEKAHKEGCAHGKQGDGDVTLYAVTVAPVVAVAQKTLFKIIPTSKEEKPEAPSQARERAAALHLQRRLICDGRYAAP